MFLPLLLQAQFKGVSFGLMLCQQLHRRRCCCLTFATICLVLLGQLPVVVFCLASELFTERVSLPDPGCTSPGSCTREQDDYG